MVDQLLRLDLIQTSCLHITLNINIDKCRRATERHRPAVLRFHRGQIGKVQPLHRFLCVHGWTREIKAVVRRHLLNLQQRAAVLRQLFAQADRGFEIVATLHFRLEIGKLQFALAYQIADAVQRHAAVITNNTPATVAIRQAGEHTRFTAAHHIRRIDVKYALVMCFTQMREQIFELRIHFTAVGFE
ncbi:hypothetical protein D3C78_641110 [compost metagenome]